MTSPAAAPPRRPTGEQLIAALLVGTVVVLLGFASGLGLGPATVTAAQSGPARGPGSTGGAPAGTPAAPATTAPPPVAYVVAPVPAASPVAAPPRSSRRPAPLSTPAVSPSARPSPPATSPGVPGVPGVPGPPACSPSLVTALLQLLLPNAARPGGDLLELGGLLTMLSHLQQTAEALLAAPAGRLLEQVTGLLGRPGVMSPGVAPPGVAPEALAQSCATDVGRALRLVAAGRDAGSAAREVGR